jgi:hypothetical protein
VDEPKDKDEYSIPHFVFDEDRNLKTAKEKMNGKSRVVLGN